MPKVLQVLIGAACLVIIAGGGWIALTRYSAHLEAEEFATFQREMNIKRTVSQCNEMQRSPAQISVFLRDSCNLARRELRELD